MTLSVIASLTPPDWDVQWIDENLTAYDEESELEKLRSSDLVGISVMTSEAKRAYEISRKVRELGKTVVLGGHHVMGCPDEAAEYADAIVLGRAEAVWENVLRDFENGALKKRYENEHEICFVSPNKRSQPWLSTNDSSYHGTYTIQHMTYTTIGCAQQCKFCFNSKRKLPFSARDVSEVRKELEDFRGQYIAFCDDDITANKKHAKELFNAIKDLDLKWLGFASMKIGLPERRELLDLAAEAGCQWLFIGFETFSSSVLSSWSKRSNNPQQYAEIADAVHSVGIKVCSSFIIGAEGEEMEDVRLIGDFVDKASPERVDIYFLTPFPGTVLYDEVKDDPRLLTKDWSLYDAQHIVADLCGTGRDVMIEKYNMAWKDAYSWKSVVKRSLLDKQWGLKDRLTLFFLNKYKRRSFRIIAGRLTEG